MDDICTYVCVMHSISAPAGETGDRILSLLASVCIFVLVCEDSICYMWMTYVYMYVINSTSAPLGRQAIETCVYSHGYVMYVCCVMMYEHDAWILYMYDIVYVYMYNSIRSRRPLGRPATGACHTHPHTHPHTLTFVKK